ncbi:hypothetical protein ZIOFF_050494 [Zingiber officinale]|uniref:Uncharacterized protein n=1 Tax=Zingiber officinale TaxID=94328 RepID=A0A8J5FIZ1_ZINOF|nr:hypothetical protein ZIOFF_050494 [Zingiber officinale]
MSEFNPTLGICEEMQPQHAKGSDLEVGRLRALSSNMTQEPGAPIGLHQEGKVILEAAILTAVVVLSLTLYTFWAARRGHDLNFLGPFLFAALWVVLVFALIQTLFPLGKLSTMIYGGPAAMVFSDYIVYDTNNLIKRYSYDQYIWAAISLYLDILNLFLSLLTLFRAADS